MIAFLIAASASAAIDPGPRPSWDEAIRIGNRAILERMIDPGSTLIAWPFTFFGGELGGGLFGKAHQGWITCGIVNAKNRMGGYSGPVPFLIVIRDGQAISLDIGSPDGVDPATPSCKEMIAKGRIHASGAPAEPAPPQ
jgi:hypothetical protein